MLIRIRGAQAGIKKYLEGGAKQGRDHTRDELDERVVLAGDLDFTNQLIERLDLGSERYLHITLSFKEDEIPDEVLRAITKDFQNFAFSAYREDEYNFYAEAHLPKLKSYEHCGTGELVERKPHIHIIVPKINLLSGGALDMFGLVRLCEKHIDAFQEHVNNKYGLASPKENRRVQFNDASDVIERYKGDQFEGGNKELKKAILDQVLDRDITSYDDFRKLVEEFGATRTRNAGRENEYLNVKPDGCVKGVNLKDQPFCRWFIELSRDEKQRILSTEIERKYEIQKQARVEPGNVAAALEDWHRFRAREIKYVNSGNRKLYQAYREAAPAGRETMLDQLEEKFYTKYGAPTPERDRFTGQSPFEHDHRFRQLEFGQGRGETSNWDRSQSPADREPTAAGTPIYAGEQRTPMSIAAFEQGRGATGHRQASDGHALLATSPFDTNQEQNHEPERYIGKNAVDHRYGFKRPPGPDQQDSHQDRPGKQPGYENGRAGGYDRRVGQRAVEGAGETRGDGGDRLSGHPDRQHDFGTLARLEKTESINRLRRLPGGHVVRPGREDTQLLPDHAPDQLGNGREGARHKLRRPCDRQPIRATGRVDDSVVSQVARDFEERQRSVRTGRLPEFQEIKQNLDAGRLLAELSRSHGVIMAKYQVTIAMDGSPRIRCGTRNLNVCDFLTKEMRLPWAEAATLLRRSYSRQMEQRPAVAPHMAPDRGLWQQFQAQRRARGGLRSQLAAQLVSERSRRMAIDRRLEDAKREAAAQPAGMRKAALSIARVEYIQAQDALRSVFRAERAPMRLQVAEQYRHFLRKRAQAGDEAALAELRRRSAHLPLPDDPIVGHILPAREQPESNALIYRGRHLRYRVQKYGDVIYSFAGRAVIRDTGSSVILLRSDRVTIETSLRLAEAKFGAQLKLSGRADFQERVARIAAEVGLRVRFDNRHAEEVRQQRAGEVESERFAGRRFVETHSTTQPKADKSVGTGQRPVPSSPDITLADVDRER